MGSHCNLHLYAEDFSEAEDTANLVIDEIQRIEERYSRYRPDSLLSEINRAALRGEKIEVDEETAGLLDYAMACGGLFDISAGVLREAWDFDSGVLPSQEKIDGILPRVGMDKIKWNAPRLEFLVPGMDLDLGGDIFVIGPHVDGAPWEIGIRHPEDHGTLITSVELSQVAFAISGDYERCMEIGGKRYGHIINPLTGWPARGLASVSVVAGRCMVAGSICTIVRHPIKDKSEGFRSINQFS